MKSRTEHYYYIQKTTIVLTQLRIVNIASTLKAINVHSRLVHDLRLTTIRKTTQKHKSSRTNCIKVKVYFGSFHLIKTFPSAGAVLPTYTVYNVLARLWCYRYCDSQLDTLTCTRYNSFYSRIMTYDSVFIRFHWWQLDWYFVIFFLLQ